MPHSLAGLWRWIAAGYLIVVEPCWMALTADAALPRLLTFGAPAVALLVARILVTAGGLAAGLAVWRREQTATILGRLWAAASAGVVAASMLTPYFPNHDAPSERRLALLTAVAFYAVWFAAFALQARTERRRPGPTPDPSDA